MVNLKMSDEDSKLLLKPLMEYTSKHRPMRYGGELDYNPPITEEEWVRLTELIDVLYHNKK